MRQIKNISEENIEKISRYNSSDIKAFQYKILAIHSKIKDFNKYDSYSSSYYLELLGDYFVDIAEFECDTFDLEDIELINSLKREVDNIRIALTKEVSDSFVEESYYDHYLDEMKRIHSIKNADYGDSFNKSINNYGYTSAFSRVSDKLSRAMNLIESGQAQVKDESIEDSLLDAANYLIMTAEDIKQRKDKNEKLIWSINPSDMKI